MISKSRTVIVVAGGKGERMHANVPKQFLMLHRQPVLMHTLRRFHSFDSSMKIIVVLPEAQVEYWNQLCYDFQFEVDHQVITGGPGRFFSVLHGLMAAPDNGLIAVHDGVRPLVSAETIEQCFDKAAETGAAIPVTEAVESIRQLTAEGSRSVDRTQYKLVQTPQVFEAQLLKKAYSQEFSALFTDDASVVEAYGHAVDLVPGNAENIKITTPIDLRIAELLIK